MAKCKITFQKRKTLHGGYCIYIIFSVETNDLQPFSYRLLPMYLESNKQKEPDLTFHKFRSTDCHFGTT